MFNWKPTNYSWPFKYVNSLFEILLWVVSVSDLCVIFKRTLAKFWLIFCNPAAVIQPHASVCIWVVPAHKKSQICGSVMIFFLTSWYQRSSSHDLGCTDWAACHPAWVSWNPESHCTEIQFRAWPAWQPECCSSTQAMGWEQPLAREMSIWREAAEIF